MTNNTHGLNGWVYFLRASDAIKIGFSYEPKSRVQSIQTAHHVDLDLLAAVPTSILSERDAHDKFGHLHIRGEWFRAEADLLDFIAELARPEPAPETAPERMIIVTREMRDLMALRARLGSDTPAGHRCSNLIEQLGNMQIIDDEGHRAMLAGLMRDQADDLQKLLIAA